MSSPDSELPYIVYCIHPAPLLHASCTLVQDACRKRPRSVQDGVEQDANPADLSVEQDANPAISGYSAASACCSTNLFSSIGMLLYESFQQHRHAALRIFSAASACCSTNLFSSIGMLLYHKKRATLADGSVISQASK